MQPRRFLAQNEVLVGRLAMIGEQVGVAGIVSG